jgi:hypothetical protein
MRGISWLAAKPVSFSRRTLLHAVSKEYYWLQPDVPARTDCAVQRIKCCSCWWTNDIPKHVESVNEKIKIIHKNLCISLLYIHIAIWCTVHTTSNQKWVYGLQNCERIVASWHSTQKNNMSISFIYFTIILYILRRKPTAWRKLLPPYAEKENCRNSTDTYRLTANFILAKK